jgi:hypothetical protein
MTVRKIKSPPDFFAYAKNKASWAAEALCPTARPNGYGRKFIPHIPVEEQYTRQIFSEFGLEIKQVDPFFGVFFGRHFKDGACVHLHTDPVVDEESHHVRCNIVVKQADAGGAALVSGYEVPLFVGDMWIVFASIEEHGSTPIQGPERMILSFGAVVDKQVAETAYKNVMKNVKELS